MSFLRRIFQTFAEYRITRFVMRRVLAFVSPRNYVGAVGVIFNERGEVLLAQHSYRTDYEWGLPGGWVAHGENPADTVVREIAEELKLDITVERLLICGKVPAVRRSTAPPHIGLAYLCRAVGGTVRTSHEIVDVEWVEPARVNRKLAPFQMEAIESAAKAAPYAGPPLRVSSASVKLIRRRSPDRLKILLLNHNVVWSGGTFFRAYNFGRELARRGHEVDLVSISPHRRYYFDREFRDGMTIWGSPDLLWGRGRTGWDVWDCMRRLQFIRRHEWDIVHAFDSRLVVIGPALFARARGTPLVLDWADWWGRGGTIEERPPSGALRALVRPFETFFEERFRLLADATTVICSALQQRAMSHGISSDRILRLPQGSDVDNVTPGDRLESRQHLNLPSDAPLIGYLGVLNQSDAKLLFQTFDEVHRRRPDVRMLMIGNPQVKLPVNDAILATGFVSREQMADYLAACDLLLLPLKDTIASRGRWPSKINEYFAAGRAIVATNVGDSGELFTRYPIGKATADTPEAMADAVLELLQDDVALAAMGKCARELAERVFAWPILTDGLEAYYRQVIAAA